MPRISITLEENLHDQIMKNAEKQNLSTSQYASFLLTLAMKHEGNIDAVTEKNNEAHEDILDLRKILESLSETAIETKYHTRRLIAIALGDEREEWFKKAKLKAENKAFDLVNVTYDAD